MPAVCVVRAVGARRRGVDPRDAGEMRRGGGGGGGRRGARVARTRAPAGPARGRPGREGPPTRRADQGVGRRCRCQVYVAYITSPIQGDELR